MNKDFEEETLKVTDTFIIPFNSEPLQIDKLTLTWDGIKQDKHASRTVVAATQDALANAVTKGSEILNLRQISLISQEELNEIALKMNVNEIPLNFMRANIVTSGFKHLTQLPFGTQIHFEFGAVLLLTGENHPCGVTGKRIQESLLEEKNIIASFVKEGEHKRGVTAIVLRPGLIYAGQEARVRIPVNKYY